MIEKLEEVVRECGAAIMPFHGNCGSNSKEDGSPVTQADKTSHDYLVKVLPRIKDAPVLSEESIVSYSDRRHWSEFWLIDPLDGTKEFMHGFKDFCINIALIKEGVPVLGVIYAPALDELYIGGEESGFLYKGPDQCFPAREGRGLLASVSRFHSSEPTDVFIKRNSIKDSVKIGSALKFGRLALGEFDIYPRFQGSYEWDIASGHAILKQSQCQLIDLESGQEPLYNKENLRNNFFIALNHGIGFSDLLMP